ncbi:MAG: hypothetical protein LC130_12635 [Bryobacterales bacterium]|nr:hypothetical protein [Bryobacterales bacterium]
MKKLFPILFSAVALGAAADQQTFVGVITDTMCGADHKAMKISPESKCVKECIRMDKKVKYALYDGRNVYTLSDQQSPEAFAAQKVKITGKLFEKTKILQVAKIEAAK